ncbi:MAG: hypothetical protein AABX39_03645 [Nanoarchaeota archaeon]
MRKKKDILKRWEEIAKKTNANVSRDFIYGDKLYEEVFSKNVE